MGVVGPTTGTQEKGAESAQSCGPPGLSAIRPPTHPLSFFGLNLPGGSYGPGKGVSKWAGSSGVPLRFLETLQGRG